MKQSQFNASIIMYNLLIPFGKFFSACDPFVVMKEQWAAEKRSGEQLGVQCLAQGHFDMQWGERGIEPATLWLRDGRSPDCQTPAAVKI